MTKLYDQVKMLLENNPRLRNSDKALIWAVLSVTSDGIYQGVSRERFMACPSFESITRARRKVQELNPWLQATKQVRRERAHKASQKGTFIFREPGQQKLV